MGRTERNEMIITVFDTETTGFPSKGETSIEEQPYVVQLAATQFYDRRPVAHLSAIFDYGIIIPDKPASIHGITTEIAAEIGVDPLNTLKQFQDMVLYSDRLVAHNAGFDSRLLEITCERHDLQELDSLMKGTETICTMMSSMDVCAIPNRWGNNKWPNLQEAHMFFTGESFEGAHDAMVDTVACARVYFGLIDGNHDLRGGLKR